MVYQEVNGGFLHVDSGSTAHFLGDLEVNDFEITSVTEEGSDFSQDVFDGGCIWNNVWRICLLSIHKRRAVEIYDFHHCTRH